MRNKTKNQKFYRRPRTTQERRVNGKRSKWCRGKRRAGHLPDTYDDPQACIQKTWKVKRRHQYRECGRGQQHKIFLPSKGGPRYRFWVNIWELEEYLNNHEIPFRVEKVEKVDVREDTHQRVYKCTGWEPYTVTYNNRPWPRMGNKKVKTIVCTETRWRGIYSWVWVKLAQPRVGRWYTLVGYNITWWSDKDIGIDRILQGHVSSYGHGHVNH